VQQLYSKFMHLYEQCSQAVKDRVSSHLDHSTVIRCVCMHSFVLHFILHILYYIIVTWWSGPSEIEAYLYVLQFCDTGVWVT